MKRSTSSYVRKTSELPPGTHYAILWQDSYTSTAYDQADTYQYLNIEVYESEAEWKLAIQAAAYTTGYSRKEFTAAIIQVPKIDVKVTVNVGV